MWGCALGPLEASAQMAAFPRKEERNKERWIQKDEARASGCDQ